MVVSRSKSSKNIESTAPLLNNLSDGMQRNAFCRNLMFYVFMACLLLPIAAFAFWGVQNARPRAVSCWPSSIGQRRYLIGYENDYWFHWVKIFSTELATGETTFRSLGPTQNHPRFGVLGSKIWALAEKSKDHFVLQLADLQDDQIQENCDVQIADQEELERGICVVDHRIIRLRSGKLESTDFFSGSMVDSVSFPNQEQSFLHPISDTKNFLVSGDRNPISKVRTTCLLAVAEGRIEQLSNWSELHHLQFKVGSASYIACLLADGLSIEVIAVPSLFAMWTALSRRSWVSRWGIWTIAIIGHETLATGITGDVFPRELSQSAIITTLFCFYAYRLRGWRLSRRIQVYVAQAASL